MTSSLLQIRTCRGCHQRFPQKNLLRIVRSPRGEILLDLDRKGHQKLEGRGVYLCKKMECLKRILPGKRKSPVAYFLKASIPPEFFDTLKKLYEGFSEES